MAKTKTFKCREKASGCLSPYERWTSNIQLQACCTNRNCIMQKTEKVRDKREATERRKLAVEKKAGRERSMTIPARLKRAREKSFQVWVKVRDFAWFELMDKQPACIMCGATDPKSWHACHYQSVGSKPELQMHPSNCHLGCSHCNLFAAQGDTDYRKNLIIKEGIEVVEYLENFNSTFRWDHEEIEEARKHYQQLTKEMKHD